MDKVKKIRLMKSLCGWNSSISLYLTYNRAISVVLGWKSYDFIQLNAELLSIAENKTIEELNNRDTLIFMNDLYRALNDFFDDNGEKKKNNIVYIELDKINKLLGR